jgi:hypothetical protein
MISMKKLMLSVVPLLAVIAFAAMPAMASAATKEYGTCATGTPETKPPCKTGEKFTAFKGKTEFTAVTGKKVSAKFVLEAEGSVAGIECTSYTSAGKEWNESGVGQSEETLTFDECKGTGALAGCEVNPTTAKHEITGVVTNVVLSETEIEIKVVSGFNVKCGTTEEGNVTGSAKGTQALSSNVTKFPAKATEFNLKFAGLDSSITGEAETVTTTGSKKVFIN